MYSLRKTRWNNKKSEIKSSKRKLMLLKSVHLSRKLTKHRIIKLNSSMFMIVCGNWARSKEWIYSKKIHLHSTKSLRSFSNAHFSLRLIKEAKILLSTSVALMSMRLSNQFNSLLSSNKKYCISKGMRRRWIDWKGRRRFKKSKNRWSISRSHYF